MGVLPASNENFEGGLMSRDDFNKLATAPAGAVIATVFTSDPINAVSPNASYQLGPAVPGKLFIPVSILFVSKTKGGTLTTQPLCKIGNSAANNNITASSILCTTAQFNLTQPAQSRNTPISVESVIDLTTPLLLIVTTPAAGAATILTVVACVVGFVIDA